MHAYGVRATAARSAPPCTPSWGGYRGGEAPPLSFFDAKNLWTTPQVRKKSGDRSAVSRCVAVGASPASPLSIAYRVKSLCG